MPTGRTPTQRQKRLGAELRKARIAAGVTTEYAAGLLGLDRTKVANMESSTRAISAERVRTLTSNYAFMDPALAEALVAMAERGERGWWEEYRGTLPPGLLDIAELEWHAKGLQTMQTVHVPGLLQTEEYARAVFSAVLPPRSRLDVELRVAHRMQRHRVLEGTTARPYTGYLHEAALRMQFGGRKVMREQVDHLCAESEHDHITLRVLPVSSGAFPGAGHALLYADGPVSQLDTVQLDTAHGAEFTYAEAQLGKYRAYLDWMAETSLPPRESREFMYDIARSL